MTKAVQMFTFFTLLGLIPSAAWSLDIGTKEEPTGLEIHAFVSQGFFVTTENQYLSDASKRGSFELTEMGLNFTKQVTEDLRVGVQLFAHKVGVLGNYNAKFDWFYLDYHWSDQLGFRAGRIKIPFGLYNEVNDVDTGRAWVLLPQSIYPIQNRNFLLAQTGGELYGYADLGDAGALDYRAYGGTIFIDLTESVNRNPSLSFLSLSVPYLTGTRVLWETPLEGFRTGGSVQYLRLDTDLLYDQSLYGPLVTAGQLPATFTGKVSAEIPALLWVASAEYLHDDLLLAAEYSRWHVRVRSSEPLLLPESRTTSERAYAMAAYRLTPWFEPGVYYSVFFPNVSNRTGREAYQHDVAATLRFDINDFWLVKMEGHYYRGTAGLNSTLNDDKALTTLDDNWGAFFVKTTAHF
jgi:hypothetical protein